MKYWFKALKKTINFETIILYLTGFSVAYAIYGGLFGDGDERYLIPLVLTLIILIVGLLINIVFGLTVDFIDDLKEEVKKERELEQNKR